MATKTAASKKATPKKTAPKKAAPKKATPKAAPKKATPKKATPKKAAPKKAAAGKAAAPKTAAPKTAAATKTAAVVVEVVSDQAVRQLCSDGRVLYGAARAGLLRFDEGSAPLSFQVTPPADLHAVAAGATLVAGGKGLWSSTDGGASVAPCALPPGVDLTTWNSEVKAIAHDPEGNVYAAGEVLLVGRPGQPFRRVEELGRDPRVRMAESTPFGALLSTYTGALWIGSAGQLRKTTLRGGGFLGGATLTPTGTLVIVGHGKGWSAKAFRSVNQARTFAPVRLPAKCPPLDDVACLPDGRLIAGGKGGVLLLSTDDGASFKPLPVPNTGKTMLTTGLGGAFETLCAHQGAVYAGGPAQALVRIR